MSKFMTRDEEVVLSARIKSFLNVLRNTPQLSMSPDETVIYFRVTNDGSARKLVARFNLPINIRKLGELEELQQLVNSAPGEKVFFATKEVYCDRIELTTVEVCSLEELEVVASHAEHLETFVSQAMDSFYECLDTMNKWPNLEKDDGQSKYVDEPFQYKTAQESILTKVELKRWQMAKDQVCSDRIKRWDLELLLEKVAVEDIPNAD